MLFRRETKKKRKDSRVDESPATSFPSESILVADTEKGFTDDRWEVGREKVASIVAIVVCVCV